MSTVSIILYSCWRALRKQDSEGYAPFLSVSLAAARPSAPFLSSLEPVSTDFPQLSRCGTVRTVLCTVSCPAASVVGSFPTFMFTNHYQVDDDEGAAVLSAEAYGGDDESSWLLLEPVADVGC